MKSLLQRVEQARESVGIPWRAFVLSAGFHALLLAALSPWRGHDSTGVAPPPTLHAELRAAPVPVAVSPQPTFPSAPLAVRRQPPVATGGAVVSDSRAEALPEILPAATRPAEPAGVPQDDSTTGPVTVAIAPAAVPEGPDAAGLRQYRLALAGEARRYRSYPEAARRAGLSGVAEVRIVVEADGAARSAQLSRSSGHALLDAAALEMLGKAAPRASLPDSLRGQNFAVLLPVVFEVEE